MTQDAAHVVILNLLSGFIASSPDRGSGICTVHTWELVCFWQLGLGSSVLLVMGTESSRTILFRGYIRRHKGRVDGAGRTLRVHTFAA